MARSNLALVAGSGRLKKFFYALRPALCLRWLRLHPDVAVRRWTSRQSSRARTREVGHAPVPGVLQALVAEELALAEVEQARLESAGGTGDRDVAPDRADAFPLDLLGLRESAASR